MRTAIERTMPALALLSTLALAFHLWDQPRHVAELARRVDALEARPPAPSALPIAEDQVAAVVLHALEPRLEALARAHPEKAEPAPAATRDAVAGTAPSAEQVAAAATARSLLDRAISRGRLDPPEDGEFRDAMRAIGGAPEGQALLARFYAAVNKGLQVDLRAASPMFSGPVHGP